MNAIKFIKEHGVEKAREVIEGAPRNAVHYWQIPRCKHGVYSSLEQNQGRAIVLEDLKRLIESVDLVTAWGGLESTYSKFRYAQEHKNTYAANMIQQAIADCEAIYGGEHV